MPVLVENNFKRMKKAKPFVKWVGGKTQLIDQLQPSLPQDLERWDDVTYIEPFVGGGAMLFYMLQTYPNITKAVINDINPNLINCYKMVRDETQKLIYALRSIQKEYLSIKTEDGRKDFFLLKRAEFNQKNLSDIDNAMLFFFLNRTCFNGLYRVNKKGFFNVPFGRYANPNICDEDTLWADSEVLQPVKILCGDFEHTLNEARTRSLFYFDPPYRPLNQTSSFNDYSKENFNDEAQVRLKNFCDKVHNAGHIFLLSNSDCLSKGGDRFFDDLFSDYRIDRVWASRAVNANPAKRGKLTEILVRNYGLTQSNSYDHYKIAL